MKLTKNKFIAWGHFSYKVDNGMINRDLLKNAIDTFFKNKIEGKYNKDIHIGFIARIGSEDGAIKSLNNFTRVNDGKEDKKYMLDLLLHILEFREEGYTYLLLNRIIFTYAVFEGKTEVRYNETKPNLFKKVTPANYSNYIFPVVIPSGIDQIYNYGNVISIVDSKLEEGQNVNKFFTVQSSTNNLFYLVQHYGDDQKTLFNKVTVFKNSNVVMEFLDKYEVGASVWHRYISKREYTYNLNGELQFMSQNKYVTRRINSTALTGFMESPDASFLAFDFETFNSTPNLAYETIVPYLLAFYTEDPKTKDKEIKSFFLTDYTNPQAMVENALKFLVDYHKEMAIIHKADYELEYKKYLAVQTEKAKYLELLDPEFKFKPKARRDD